MHINKVTKANIAPIVYGRLRVFRKIGQFFAVLSVIINMNIEVFKPARNPWLGFEKSTLNYFFGYFPDNL